MKKPAFSPPAFILSRFTCRSAVAGSTPGVAKLSGMSSWESSVINAREGCVAAVALRPSFGAQEQRSPAVAAAISRKSREVIISTSFARRFGRKVVPRFDRAHERVCHERDGEQRGHQVHREI